MVGRFIIIYRHVPLCMWTKDESSVKLGDASIRILSWIRIIRKWSSPAIIRHLWLLTCGRYKLADQPSNMDRGLVQSKTGFNAGLYSTLITIMQYDAQTFLDTVWRFNSFYHIDAAGRTWNSRRLLLTLLFPMTACSFAGSGNRDKQLYLINDIG